MALHDNPTTVNLSGPMGDDYTVVVSTVNGALSVEIVLHNSEASLAEVMLYTVDPDGWVVTNLQPSTRDEDFIVTLPEALR
jgi:hypothetical protein